MNERFSPDCETHEEAEEYFRNCSIQLRGDNIALVPNSFRHFDYGCSAQFRDLETEEVYDSLYVLKSGRGNMNYSHWLETEATGRILTAPDCRLELFLENHKIPYRVAGAWMTWPEYEEITRHYGDARAKRSGLYYMNHIDEGIAILRKFGVEDYVLKAWMLHPLFQVDLENFHKRNYGGLKLDMEVVMMAMAYRETANSYLPRNVRDKVPEVKVKELHLMLLADKIQNAKDCRRNPNIEPWREDGLALYFGKWRLCLDPKDEHWSRMTDFISME